MTIAKRLIILLGVPLAALIGLGVFSRLQLSRVEERTQFLAELQIPSLAVLGNLSRSFSELRLELRDYLLAANQAEQNKARSAFEAAEARVNDLLRQYADSLISDEQDRRLLEDYRVSSREWIDSAQRAMA